MLKLVSFLSILAVLHVLTGPLIAASKTTIEGDPQQRFVAGVEALQGGNYELAERIFTRLLADTSAPRVKLEPARTLFLLREFERSRQLFKEVLDTPGIPWQVRENVQFYLDEIDASQGFTKYYVAVVTDNNPRNFTGQKEFVIGGQTLILLPPGDNEDVTGIQTGVRAYRPLSVDKSVVVYFDGYFIDFPGSNFDRINGDFGFQYRLQSYQNLRLKIGMENEWFAGHYLYAFPYMSLLSATSLNADNLLQGEFRIGNLRIPEARHLDAVQVQTTGSLLTKLSQRSTLVSYLQLEFADTKEDSYTYQGATLGNSVAAPLLSTDIRLNIFGSYGWRKYAGPDPFFEGNRTDRMAKFGITVEHPMWRIFGYKPTFGINIERNDSSLPYFSYDKIGLIIRFSDD